MNPTLLMMACVLVAEPQKDQAFREDSLGSGGRYESTRVDPSRPPVWRSPVRNRNGSNDSSTNPDRKLIP